MSQVKPISPGAVDIQDENNATPDYVKAKSGRVFVATPAIVKQFRKGKFGMIEITKKQYDAAIAKEAKGSGSKAEGRSHLLSAADYRDHSAPPRHRLLGPDTAPVVLHQGPA